MLRGPMLRVSISLQATCCIPNAQQLAVMTLLLIFRLEGSPGVDCTGSLPDGVVPLSQGGGLHWCGGVGSLSDLALFLSVIIIPGPGHSSHNSAVSSSQLTIWTWFEQWKQLAFEHVVVWSHPAASPFLCSSSHGKGRSLSFQQIIAHNPKWWWINLTCLYLRVVYMLLNIPLLFTKCCDGCGFFMHTARKF